MNILEEMQTEQIRADAAGSLGDAGEQIKKLIKLERISIAAVACIVGASLVLSWPWLIPAAGIAAPTALFPPQTAAAKKLTAAQRKHLIPLIWTQCAQKGGVSLFIVLMLLYGMGNIGNPFQSGDPFAAGNVTSGTLSAADPFIAGIIFFMIYRSFSKIRFYKKTLKHVAAQQTNLTN